ncbi:MAG TPA: YfhO family protein [Vicinamibacteria bacterium]|jgi:hypothetical protein
MSARRDALALALLAILPVVAHAPAWWGSRLLGPGDGAVLHFPLRALVWQAYQRGELPGWNPTIFLGTPLLAAYRPGAFFPPMAPLALLPPFAAFQVLVLASLSAAAVLTFLYLRRLGANRLGAYAAGLFFSLGPYLVGHLGDTATVVAAPLLPLLLLAAESHVQRASAGRVIGLAAALALLLLAGSPEAARAGGALLAGRLLVARFFPSGPRPPSWRATAAAIGAGVLLAAPQLVPTLFAAADAGRQVTGLAGSEEPVLPGLTGLALRYVSHTPAPSLALAALPLTLTQTPVRVLALALAVCVGLQWGRGPLSAPGALALVFDLTLSVLAGLSLSTQWSTRTQPWGRRLRAYFLFASLASAVALSVSAAALGPLPQTLAGAVGVLALALMLYFPLAGSPDTLKAGLWLLPLTVSFLLQPHGRRIWDGAPTRNQLFEGTITRQAIDRAVGTLGGERFLTLARDWPREEAIDLAYGNLAALAGRRSANGYDPMAPLRTRLALGAMSAGGTLPGAFFRTDPARLEMLDVRWVQLPLSALTARADVAGLGDRLDLTIEPGRPRFFPLPIMPASEVVLASHLADAVAVGNGEVVAVVHLRLASGRELPLPIRAGEHTAEWAWDRADVRSRVAHARAPVLESWPAGGFEGHRYLATLVLPGRYHVDGARLERAPGSGHFVLSRLAVRDSVSGRLAPVSLPSAYVSDMARLREVAVTPAVRLFALPLTARHARVADRLRLLADDDAVLRALGGGGLDPHRDALAVQAEVPDLTMPDGAQSSRAEVARAEGGRLDVLAEGPGLLVVAEAWDRGWSAEVDGHAARIFRVDHAQMALPLPAGRHRIALRYHARGLLAGAGLSLGAALGLAGWWMRERAANG